MSGFLADARNNIGLSCRTKRSIHFLTFGISIKPELQTMKTYYVYILASKQNGTLYVGFTNDLRRRMYEHKNGIIEGFTKKYGVNRLVYFEESADVNAAIRREKQIKGWRRDKKIALIESINPDWEDLSREWFVDSSLRSE
jgi:putative endonuclease